MSILGKLELEVEGYFLFLSSAAMGFHQCPKDDSACYLFPNSLKHLFHKQDKGERSYLRFLIPLADTAIWLFSPPWSGMLSQCVLGGVHGEESARGLQTLPYLRLQGAPHSPMSSIQALPVHELFWLSSFTTSVWLCLSQVSNWPCLVFPCKCLSILRFGANWLSCDLSCLMGSRKVMNLQSVGQVFCHEWQTSDIFLSSLCPWAKSLIFTFVLIKRISTVHT